MACRINAKFLANSYPIQGFIREPGWIDMANLFGVGSTQGMIF